MHLVSNNIKCLHFTIYKLASLACAARLANTVSAGGALRAPGVTFINYKGDNIFKYKYVCPTVIIDNAQKSYNLSILKILMCNDGIM